MNLYKNIVKTIKRALNAALDYDDNTKNRTVIYTIGFICTFIVIYVYTILHTSIFYYDAEEYWTLAHSFINQNGFSFLNYSASLRWYLFPFINFIQIFISGLLKINEIDVFKLFSALFFSIFIFIVIPKLMENVFNKKITLIRRFLLFFLIFFFWRGYFLYPLTDFYSLFFLCIALLITNNKKASQVWIYIILGMALLGSMLIRPAYAMSILPAIIYDISLQKKLRLPAVMITRNIVLVLLGMLLISSPQIYINYNKLNTINPFVQAGGLYQVKLFRGLYTQKFESNVGKDLDHSSIIFLDKQGAAIVQKENLIYPGFNNYFEYLSIVAKYPVDLISIYFRHIFNGIDVRYDTPYVYKIYQDRTVFTFLNAVVWFIFFLALYENFKSLLRCKAVWTALIMLLPVVLAIPCEIEVRYFLPLYILCYVIIVETNIIKNILNNPFDYIKKFGLSFILYTLMYITLSACTFSMIH